MVSLMPPSWRRKTSHELPLCPLNPALREGGLDYGYACPLQEFCLDALEMAQGGAARRRGEVIRAAEPGTVALLRRERRSGDPGSRRS